MRDKNSSGVLVPALVMLVVIVACAQQAEKPEPQLSARDMFRKAAGRLVPAKAAGQPEATKPGGKTAQPDTSAAKAAAETRAAKRPATAEPRKPAGPRPVDSGQPQAVAVSYEEPLPLGLRYSLLKQASGGGTTEVDTDTVFHSGDRIRLSIESNDTAYLYIVHQGSSGQWKVLFPAAEIGGGNNRVEPGYGYSIPPRHWFAFDEQVGEERLFVLLSRQPEQDLESLIYQLQGPGKPAKRPREEKEPLLLAMNIPPIEDSVIDRLRSRVASRDLVFEKVDEGEAEGEKEKAVYIVNRTGEDEARVIADITLKHE